MSDAQRKGLRRVPWRWTSPSRSRAWRASEGSNAFNQNAAAARRRSSAPSSKILTLELQRPQDLRGPGAQAPRPGAGDRPHGLGQSPPRWRHDPTTPQQKPVRPHPHHRGPDPSSCTGESKYLVNQREVGPMTLSFSAALRSGAARGPGEMRDLEVLPPGHDGGRSRPPGVRHAAPPAPPRRSTASSTCSRPRRRRWCAPSLSGRCRPK